MATMRPSRSAASAAASAGALPSILDARRAPVKHRTAGGTRQRLGVEAPIERVGVFGGALRGTA